MYVYLVVIIIEYAPRGQNYLPVAVNSIVFIDTAPRLYYVHYTNGKPVRMIIGSEICIKAAPIKL